MAIGPFDEELLETTDYLMVATDLRAEVGDLKSGYLAKVVGFDPETGSQVGVAYYDREYEYKADARARSKELLRVVKYLRSAEED